MKNNIIVKMTVALALACALAIVAGCAAFTARSAQNAQQGVFGIKTGYTEAVETAAAYAHLVPCPAAAPGTKVCSNPSLVRQMDLAKDLAKPIIDGAEKTVRDPAFDVSTSDAVLASARNALAALTSISNTIAGLVGKGQVNP